ncbi:MAG: RES family NAD+ phosphorylase [Verrucomicrobiota bacterium]|nr:RES family NAD+ phosphorylase [Verrucomicrobiota bacterium]
MKIRPHPRFEDLRRRLARPPDLLQPWEGAAYRATTLDYPRPKSILLGQGSFLYGGRWNSIGSYRAVYGSTEDTVAVAESRATADYAHVPMPFRIPRLLVAIDFSLQAMLDLTSPTARDQLGVDGEELRMEDWRKMQEQGSESLTQAIGRAVFANEGEGLLVPSARVSDGVNVVYFPENHRAASRATVLEAEKLDRVRLV